jgi:WD40 repeat protein
VASAGKDGTVRLWETATGSERRRLTGHRGGVFTVTFSPDGRTLASGGADGKVLLWELARPARR